MTNQFDDGLNFVNCPPGMADLRLPEFPEHFKQDCKLIRWAWNLPFPDGERMKRVVIKSFRKDLTTCGVYIGEVHFIDSITGSEWYKGKLKFYYTRNYIHKRMTIHGQKENNIVFRFVVKGDLVRVADKIPDGRSLILCTKPNSDIKPYKNIFVYGGLDILYDMQARGMKGFMFSLGHNDGWYTHHPKLTISGEGS